MNRIFLLLWIYKLQKLKSGRPELTQSQNVVVVFQILNLSAIYYLQCWISPIIRFDPLVGRVLHYQCYISPNITFDPTVGRVLHFQYTNDLKGPVYVF